MPNKHTAEHWWQRVVCYQIWPKSFYDSNGDGGGDIKGIIEKLDYLQDLGIDVIWVSPTYKSPMKDMGYDVADWQDMDPTFGTLQDMCDLIKAVHARGMKILLDLVVTHTSNEHPWFLESSSSKDNPKRDWYIWKDGRPGNKIFNETTQLYDLVEEPTNWRACFGGSAWTYHEARDQYYIHLFLIEEPDLNWENEEARKAIYEAAIGFWLDKDVDGFRIDTVNRLSKDLTWSDAKSRLVGRLQDGRDHYINGPNAHVYLKEMRKYIDEHPRGKDKDIMLVGELPRTEYAEVMEYVHPVQRELSMVFDFDMVKLGGHDDPDNVRAHEVKHLRDGHESFTLPLFKKTLKKVQDMIDDGAWGTVFMECHDQCRSIARYTTNKPGRYPMTAKLLCLMQTTLSGTEFIYQGQEIGMRDMPSHWDYEHFRDVPALGYMRDAAKENGEKGRENARQGVLLCGRDNTRTPVQWTAGKNAGFSTASTTWMDANPNAWEEGINVEQERVDPKSLLNFWRNQIELRKGRRDLFMLGGFTLLDADNKNTFSYLKYVRSEQDMAFVCLNFTDDEQVPFYPKKVLETHCPVFAAGNAGRPRSLRQILKPWEGRVYILHPR